MVDQSKRKFLTASAGAALLASSSSVKDVVAAPLKVRRIATEEHFAFPEWFDAFNKLPASPGVRYLQIFYRNPEFIRKLNDIDVRLAEMDSAGVDMQLLSLTGPGVQDFDAEQGTAVARLANDRLAAIIKEHPGRFAGLAVVAPQDPKAAAAEVERAMTELGLNGIIIYSYTQGEFLDDPKFWPIFDAAVKYRAPIYLHPDIPPDSMLEPFEKYNMVGALWGFQAECGLHVARMILGGVFDHYPDLQIVLGHMGEGLPYWLFRLDDIFALLMGDEYAPAGRRARTGGQAPGMVRLKKRPSEYFLSNFHITTSGMFWNPTLDYCVKLLGVEKIIFAVDYPFELSAAGTDWIMNHARLSPTDRAKILHGNAERVFRIKA
ncbi:MAG: amidohydrolase family protein [Xanthobacteraceae bacterium]